LRAALASTLGSSGTAVLEVHVDPAEPVSTPERLKV
jgi:pyruvate dehydrogenase (quinone)/pyruvate decarboxylase